MKRMILFAALLLCFCTAIQAQKKEEPWKVSLIKSLATEFSLTEEVSRKAVNIKEAFFRQIQAYSMPHMEVKLGREEQRKAIARSREDELTSMKALFKDDVKAKQVSDYLEPRISRANTSGQRPR